MEQKHLEVLRDIINGHSNFLITSHIIPDGDGLGSEIALKHFLEKLNKKAVIINQDFAAERYDFIDPDKEVWIYDDACKNLSFDEFEILFVLDTSSGSRLGKTAELADLYNLRTVSLDHHDSAGDLGDPCIQDREASSIGEMIYDLVAFYNVEFDMKLAMPIYLSIVSDTGSFHYPNTTPRCHEIAAHLMRVGVNPAIVNTAVFERNTMNQVILLGECMQHIETDNRGRLVWMTLTQNMLKNHSVSHYDTYFFIDYLK
ncbi:MAG: DHH family phosphoesterase, partial [bacterium]